MQPMCFRLAAILLVIIKRVNVQKALPRSKVYIMKNALQGSVKKITRLFDVTYLKKNYFPPLSFFSIFFFFFEFL